MHRARLGTAGFLLRLRALQSLGCRCQWLFGMPLVNGRTRDKGSHSILTQAGEAEALGGSALILPGCGFLAVRSFVIFNGLPRHLPPFSSSAKRFFSFP